MSLRIEAWEQLHQAGGDRAEALGLLMTLIEIGDGEPDSGLDEAIVAGLKEEAADLIPECVEALAGPQRGETIVRGPKIGRNDPCPCGSGKKYKKCCGA
jgi:uncharacterized protein YecA (UPF0149 family)